MNRRLIVIICELQDMELELRKLEEAVGSIHNEMLYLRERYFAIYPSILHRGLS